MSTISHTEELLLKLRLSSAANQRLAERAAESGQDIAGYASQLIEREVSRPSIDEVLAPYRKQVAESGMSDEELDDFHRDLLAKVRAERKANST